MSLWPYWLWARALTPFCLDTHLSIAMANVAGTLGKSSEVMKLVNGLLKLPQLQTTMREMAQGNWVLVRSVWEAGVLWPSRNPLLCQPFFPTQ